MKKDLIIIMLVTLAVYNLNPIVQMIAPETNLTILDILVINPIWVLLVSVFFAIKYGFKLIVAILLGLLFIPTVFLVYNDTAMIYIAVYFVLSMIASAIGGILHRVIGK